MSIYYQLKQRIIQKISKSLSLSLTHMGEREEVTNVFFGTNVGTHGGCTTKLAIVVSVCLDVYSRGRFDALFKASKAAFENIMGWLDGTYLNTTHKTILERSCGLS